MAMLFRRFSSRPFSAASHSSFLQRSFHSYSSSSASSSSSSFRHVLPLSIFGAACYAAYDYINSSNENVASCGAKVTTKRWHFYTGGVDQSKELDLENIRVFAGSANPELANEIAHFLGIPLSKIQTGKYADGETMVQIGENIRATHTFLIQPICKPVNDNLMELLLMASAARRASADEITAVIPYYGYSRQDRKMASRVPIAAADVALMLEEMGVDRVVSVDLHSGQTEGFFSPSVPVENLTAIGVAAIYFGEKQLNNPVIVSPDAGGVPRAKKFREFLLKQGHDTTDLAMLIESRDTDSAGRRVEKGSASRFDLVGDVKGRDVIIIEDIVDTGFTMFHAAEELKKHGATSVYAFTTHGLFSDVSVERLKNSSIDELVVTNTVAMSPEIVPLEKVKQLSLAPVFAEVIKRVYQRKTVSHLFELPTSAMKQAEKQDPLSLAAKSAITPIQQLTINTTPRNQSTTITSVNDTPSESVSDSSSTPLPISTTDNHSSSSPSSDDSLSSYIVVGSDGRRWRNPSFVSGDEFRVKEATSKKEKKRSTPVTDDDDIPSRPSHSSSSSNGVKSFKGRSNEEWHHDYKRFIADETNKKFKDIVGEQKKIHSSKFSEEEWQSRPLRSKEWKSLEERIEQRMAIQEEKIAESKNESKE